MRYVCGGLKKREKKEKRRRGNGITIFLQYFHNKFLSGRLLLANIGEKKNIFFRKRKK